MGGILKVNRSNRICSGVSAEIHLEIVWPVNGSIRSKRKSDALVLTVIIYLKEVKHCYYACMGGDSGKSFTDIEEVEFILARSQDLVGTAKVYPSVL